MTAFLEFRYDDALAALDKHLKKHQGERVTERLIERCQVDPWPLFWGGVPICAASLALPDLPRAFTLCGRCPVSISSASVRKDELSLLPSFSSSGEERLRFLLLLHRRPIRD